MKKIAVLTMGVKLHDEKGYTRFRFLSDFLVQHGFQVDLITSSFQHWEKRQRDIQNFKQDEAYRVVFIEEPGYKKNVDLRRLRSHKKAAQNLTRYLNEHGDYDLIYAEIPPNDVALAAAEYCKRKGIPFVADVNDLWPEAMRMVLDIPVISDILFYPLSRDAEKVYSLVSGVVGTSDEYADRPFKKRREDIPKTTVYVGNEIREFDDGVAKYGPEIEKPEGEYWVSYAGTIGTSYDIKTMILASAELKKRGYGKIRMMIMGGGPLKEELENLAAGLDCNVTFVGYLPYEKMAAYLQKSDITVNSFVRKAPQSIVTKIGDYLASGRPMINTCVSPEFRAKVEADGFGINIEPEDAGVLADAVEKFYKDPALAESMGKKARQIAEEQFDRPQSYLKILHLIENLLEDRHG